MELKKFDMRKIKNDEILLTIGRRNCGKSFLVKDFLYFNKDISSGIVITPKKNFYEKIMPSNLIYNDYDKNIIENLIKKQKEKQLINKNKIDDTEFLILDNCLYDFKNDEIKELILSCKYLKIKFMLTIQISSSLSSNLRSNIDYVIILKENINRKMLYEHYLKTFTTLDIFNELMDKYTENYGCLVINCKTESKKLEDKIFWYKADDYGDFRICK